MITALVLAAGLGTRIRPVAGVLPKPLIEFGGRPIIAHNLAWLAANGVQDVWINLHYAADAIMGAIGDGHAFGLRVGYLYEPELLGTAGALANLYAMHPEAVWDPTLVVYGDNLLRFDLDGLLATHRRHAPHATIALFDRNLHSHTGIAGGRAEYRDDGRIVGFVEGGIPPTPGAADLVNAGVYAVSRALCASIPQGRAVDFGRDVFPAALARGDVLCGHVIESEGFCLGLDTPASYAAGQALLASRQIELPS